VQCATGAHLQGFVGLKTSVFDLRLEGVNRAGRGLALQCVPNCAAYQLHHRSPLHWGLRKQNNADRA